jgi:hypothetical protein
MANQNNVKLSEKKTQSLTEDPIDKAKIEIRKIIVGLKYPKAELILNQMLGVLRFNSVVREPA